MNTTNGKTEKAPCIFEFTNYRTYLQTAFLQIQKRNPSFSESAFVQKAGLGANSRGYLKLVVQGKRNLSAQTILGFAKALKLTKKETEYFENLVNFNQARNERDKAHYFEKISHSIKGSETAAYHLLKGQYNYFSKWYLIPLRELISLDNFVNDPEWIASRLRNKVTVKQIKDGLEDLKHLGLVQEVDGKLIQSTPLVKFADDDSNYKVVNQLHESYLQKSIEALHQDNYEERSVSFITISCNGEDFKDLRKEIAEFREQMMAKYGTRKKDINTILHLGIQLLHITEPKVTGALQ